MGVVKDARVVAGVLPRQRRHVRVAQAAQQRHHAFARAALSLYFLIATIEPSTLSNTRSICPTSEYKQDSSVGRPSVVSHLPSSSVSQSATSVISHQPSTRHPSAAGSPVIRQRQSDAQAIVGCTSSAFCPHDVIAFRLSAIGRPGSAEIGPTGTLSTTITHPTIRHEPQQPLSTTITHPTICHEPQQPLSITITHPTICYETQQPQSSHLSKLIRP